MFDKRQVSKDLTHARDHIRNALKYVNEKDYAMIKIELSFADSILRASIDREITQRRKDDEDGFGDNI